MRSGAGDQGLKCSPNTPPLISGYVKVGKFVYHSSLDFLICQRENHIFYLIGVERGFNKKTHVKGMVSNKHQ